MPRLRHEDRGRLELTKARPPDQPLLYYGNLQAAAPRYDPSLVGGQLLAAEEQLKRSWGEDHHPGKGGVVFWGILAVVVVVLLIIISRLLPQSARAGAKESGKYL